MNLFLFEKGIFFIVTRTPNKDQDTYWLDKKSEGIFKNEKQRNTVVSNSTLHFNQKRLIRFSQEPSHKKLYC